MIINIITILSVSIFLTYTINEILKILHQDIQALVEKIVNWII
jgi:hypothetical protein